MTRPFQTAFLAGAALAAAAVAAAPAQAAETIAYSYDARGRLVQVAHAGTVNTGVTTKYTYDKADNRVTMTTTGATGCTAVVPSGQGYRVIPCERLD